MSCSIADAEPATVPRGVVSVEEMREWTVGKQLRSRAAEREHDPFLTFECGHSATYGQTLARSLTIASQLQRLDVGQMAHFKIPRYFHFVDEFPMTANGKVRKVAMREQAIGILKLGVGAAEQ